ncbi:hypothetical protein Scep_029990 [Stephania cephalantha]|uniref:Uncharacterized protein n=1 Tax=Stephania cephalantha TaxID=152367 RepID=A0AAP0HDY8_9MAGN
MKRSSLSSTSGSLAYIVVSVEHAGGSAKLGEHHSLNHRLSQKTLLPAFHF